MNRATFLRILALGAVIPQDAKRLLGQVGIEKIKDPLRQATDPVLLSHLAKARFDKDYVEFTNDYGTLTYKDKRGRNRRNYYSKRYQDRLSGKRFTVISGLPMCRQDGTKIIPGFDRGNKRHYIKTNLMEGEVADNGLISLEPVNDQPYGVLAGEALTWQPELFLDGIEQEMLGKPTLLPLDPWNNVSTNNVLRFKYGICERLTRVIPGKLKERWIFPSNPGGTVRIVHNHTGKGSFKLGQHAIDRDIEEIPAAVFDLAQYPFEIFTDSTFYPDAHVESTSVDGLFWHAQANQTWATLVGGAGSGHRDEDATDRYIGLQCGTTSAKFSYCVRGAFLFDASAISGIVSAGTFSLYGTAKVDGSGTSDSANIYESAPAANDDLVDGDFDSLGSTIFCDTAIAYGDYNTSGYNDWAINAAGITFLQAAVDGDGIVKLGTRGNIDVSGTPSWVSGAWDYFDCEMADNAGNKPKLVVTHAAAGINIIVDTKDGAADLEKIDGVGVADIEAIDGKP